MLRTMLGGSRMFGERWVEYVQRTTGRVETWMSRLSYDDWVAGYKRRKWHLAGKIATCGDDRWSKRLLHWITLLVRGRDVGRPCTRRKDCFVKIAGDDFQEIASSKELWSLLEAICVSDGSL